MSVEHANNSNVMIAARDLPRGHISLRGVAKSFRSYHVSTFKETALQLVRGGPLSVRRQVLRGVDLEVAPGERIAVVGANGAGKSTLFRVMSGILRPDRGEAIISGRVSPLIEITAGYVPDMTGAENIRLNALLLGLSHDELRLRFDDIVAFAGLQEFVDTPVRYYSSGMQARLGFAVAVHVNADVVLIDEVLAVGDQAFQARCLGKLRALAEKGVTIVLVSHDFHAVREFCDRVVWLDGGVIKRDGTAAEVLPLAAAASSLGAAKP